MAYVIPEPRELPPWLAKRQLPVQVAASLLHRHRRALAQAGREAEEARRQVASLVKAVGLALYRKQGGPDVAEFRTFADALSANGVELITHVGEAFAGDLEEMADVVDWVEAADGIEPGCVAEAFEPEIRVGGRLVHRAKLICVKEDDQ